MINLKTVLIVFFFALMCIHLHAKEVIVYKTYEDFQNNTGDKYDSLKNVWFTNLSGSLVVLKDMKKSDIGWRGIWGFKCGDDLFRIFEGAAYRVLTLGPKLCYYEEGNAYLKGILNGSSSLNFEAKIPISYLSASINEKLITLFRTYYNYNETKQVNKLKEKLSGPEYKDFFDCLNGNIHYLLLRECSQKFKQ